MQPYMTTENLGKQAKEEQIVWYVICRLPRIERGRVIFLGAENEDGNEVVAKGTYIRPYFSN